MGLSSNPIAKSFLYGINEIYNLEKLAKRFG